MTPIVDDTNLLQAGLIAEFFLLIAAWLRSRIDAALASLEKMQKKFFPIPHMRDQTQRGVLCRNWCNSAKIGQRFSISLLKHCNELILSSEIKSLQISANTK